MPVLSLSSTLRLDKLEENKLLIGIYKDLSWKKSRWFHSLIKEVIILNLTVS